MTVSWSIYVMPEKGEDYLSLLGSGDTPAAALANLQEKASEAVAKAQQFSTLLTYIDSEGRPR